MVNYGNLMPFQCVCAHTHVLHAASALVKPHLTHPSQNKGFSIAASHVLLQLSAEIGTSFIVTE